MTIWLRRRGRRALGAGGPGAGVDNLLLGDGTNFLLGDGTSVILLG